MIDAIEVPFSSNTSEFPSGGSILRKAWGMMIVRKVSRPKIKRGCRFPLIAMHGLHCTAHDLRAICPVHNPKSQDSGGLGRQGNAKKGQRKIKPK